MTPLFSILHATYQRPEKAMHARQVWFDRAAKPDAVEYIFAVNSDDPTVERLAQLAHGTGTLFCMATFRGSAPAWNAAAALSRGKLLIQGQDDVVPPLHWDELLCTELDRAGLLFPWADKPAFIAVSDGYRKDKLCCTAIMNRARYEQCGEFLFPGYLSVFSDDEVTLRAYGDAEDGKCTLIEARHLVFKHEHAYHNASVPMDDTYRKENSQEAYAVGQKLFIDRNAALLQRGLRKW
jgi:hypothetical protein